MGKRNQKHAGLVLILAALLVVIGIGLAGALVRQAAQPVGAFPESTAENTSESVPESASENASESAVEPAAPTDVHDLPWNLQLVNRQYTLSAEETPELGTMTGGYEVRKEIVEAANAFLEGARQAGYTVYCTSGYRSYELQSSLFDNKVSRVQNETGLTGQDAIDKAKIEVAMPGTSEHQTGLAMDLLTGSYSSLDEGIADTPEMQWCLAHCADYGFILRYPKDQMDKTGIIYEPWHFRYVGKEAAREITARGLVLESYLVEQYGIQSQEYELIE